MKLYHFTSTAHLPMIQAAGALLLTDSMTDPVDRAAGPPVLWLLDTPDLDGHSHGIDMPHWPVDKTEIRFTVETNDRWTTRWLDWAPVATMPQWWKDKVIEIGGGADAAAHWYISFVKVPRASWLEVRNTKTQEVLDVDHV